MTRRRLSDEEEELVNSSLFDTIEQWPDMMVWEETPFRPSDDVVLLSFGFHFDSDGSGMYKVEEDGTTWHVDLSRAVPLWMRNGINIGTLSYDRVVNEFTHRR